MSEKKSRLPKLDIKDRRILRELDMDARMPIKQLAKKVGVSRQVAEYRVNRMVKEGIIGGFYTIFETAAIGKRWFRIAVQLKRVTDEEKRAFITYFQKHPDVVWLGEVGGNWDFVINLVSEDQFSFDRLLSEILKEWGGSIQRFEVLIYINVRDQARRYILSGYAGGRETIFHDMKYDQGITLDDLERKIIQSISKDASAGYSRIAESVDTTYKTVQNRMEAMEEEKLILGYRAIANPAKLGYESYMIFLGTNAYDAQRERSLDEFLKHPNVTYVVRQLGRWRMGLEAEFRDRNEFQSFLIELRTRFDDIISEYETFPIFADHKIDYFPDGALEKRVERL